MFYRKKMVESLITQFGHMLVWLQAIGALIIAWLIFQIVAIVYNVRRMRQIAVIRQDMGRMERKLDKILGKKR